jgi:Nickel responsive protein SCO4226-like
MPKYVIEREIPGAGKMTDEQLTAISQKSCSVLEGMGPQIQWVHSYVAEDKIYCVYNAPNKEMVKEHAEKGGFPANVITRVSKIIDPVTAEATFPVAAEAN